MLREILVDSTAGETRVALLEDGLLTEIFVERSEQPRITGNVYKGRVTNILPGIQSAFVDIGLDRDAFLYVEDVVGGDTRRKTPVVEDADDEPPYPPPEARPRADIEDLIQEGQEILVQVTKDPVLQKGARITAHVTLPGRFLVFLPGVKHVGVSRRIEEPEERERLRAVGEELVGGPLLHGGLIVRTAGENHSPEDFQSDAVYLAELWKTIRHRAAVSQAPALLHAEVGAVAKVLRDVFHRDVMQVTVNTEGVHREAVGFMERMQPSLVPRVHLSAGDESLFEKRGVNAQLERALRPRVWLRSGGHIVINQTEALVAIDVNTGKYLGKRRLEETILRTNLEAVREIVRQVRLRDLGGIIVVDFIDMELPESKQQVIEALREELKKDRSKSRMLQISEFGLVEITRQRSKPSLESLLCVSCPTCGGAGRIKSAETIFFEIIREARKPGRGAWAGALRIRVNPMLLEQLRDRSKALRAALGLDDEGAIELQADPDMQPYQWLLESD